MLREWKKRSYVLCFPVSWKNTLWPYVDPIFETIKTVWQFQAWGEWGLEEGEAGWKRSSEVLERLGPGFLEIAIKFFSWLLLVDVIFTWRVKDIALLLVSELCFWLIFLSKDFLIVFYFINSLFKRKRI